MRLPLLQVNQKTERVYSTKIPARFLKEHLSLSFRYPYVDDDSSSNSDKFAKYLEALVKKGLDVDYGTESSQRRLQIDRLKSIASFLKEEQNIMPNSIILGCRRVTPGDLEDEIEEPTLTPLAPELGVYTLDNADDYEFIAIDGQHRLAGMFISGTEEVLDMELPAVLLFNPSLSTCAKVFIDINGNQKPVDKSLIYDLTALLEQNTANSKIKDKQIASIQKCHRICTAFYKHRESPFYRQIRMLGTGTGAVSQAFFVEQLYPHVHTGALYNLDEQRSFNALYYYFSAFQEAFPRDWPVLKGETDWLRQDEYAKYVLNERKSQLSKTLGIGTLLAVFPQVFEQARFERSQYSEIVGRLRGKIAWAEEDHNESPELYYIGLTSMKAVKAFAAHIGGLLR